MKSTSPCDRGDLKLDWSELGDPDLQGCLRGGLTPDSERSVRLGGTREAPGLLKM